jgi:hypothetical protein
MSSSFLKQLSFFEEVGMEEAGELEALAESRSCKAGEVVFRKGDLCDGLYVVEEGGVMIRREEPGQPMERLRDLGPGEVFGEMEVLDGGARRQLNARATSPVRLRRIPLVPLLAFFKAHPTVETGLRTLAIHRRTSRLRSRLGPTSRREPRIWVDRPVHLAVPGGFRGEVHLENLSHGGLCLVGAPGEWQPERAVDFSLGTDGRPDLLRVRGSVRWRQDGAVGIAFELSESAGSTQHRRRVDQALRELVPAPANG